MVATSAIRSNPVYKAHGRDREACIAGYCSRHYQQIRRHGQLTPKREYHPRGDQCKVEICEAPQIAKGYCFRHYQQVRRYGRLTPDRERLYGRTGCRVPDCKRHHSSRGYCKRHYMSEYYLPQLIQDPVATLGHGAGLKSDQTRLTFKNPRP